MENFEHCFEVAGKSGKYQLIIACISITTSMFLPIVLLTLPINQIIPNFTFNQEGLDNNDGLGVINNQIVDRDLFCSTYYLNNNFDQISKNIEILSDTVNWTSDLKYVCNTKKIFSLVGTFYFLGNIASNLVFNKFPDRYGRRNIFIIFNLVSFFVLLQVMFLKSYVQILITSFIMGVTTLNLSTGTVIVIETIDKSYSGSVIGITNAMFPFIGLVNLTLVYLFGNWRLVYIWAILANVAVNILSFVYLKESPTWLNANKRYEELEEVFKFIAEINGNTKEFEEFLSNPKNTKIERDPEYTSLNLEQSCKKVTHLKRYKQHVYEITDLFIYPSLRMLTIKNIGLWAITGFSFFGVLLNLEGLTGSLEIDSLVAYIAEFIAEVASGYLAFIYGRRRMILYSFSFSVIGLFGFIIITLFSKIIGLMFLFLACLGIASAFNLLYIYSSELYPTNIKGLAINILSLTNRLISCIVPTFIAYFNGSSFICILGVLSVFGFLITLQLPESMDFNPGNEVEELEEDFEDFESEEDLSINGSNADGVVYLYDITRLLKSP